jgi:hypothetical protein
VLVVLERVELPVKLIETRLGRHPRRCRLQ